MPRLVSRRLLCPRSGSSSIEIMQGVSGVKLVQQPVSLFVPLEGLVKGGKRVKARQQPVSRQLLHRKKLAKSWGTQRPLSGRLLDSAGLQTLTHILSKSGGFQKLGIKRGAQISSEKRATCHACE
jgi:hypothetical protein